MIVEKGFPQVSLFGQVIPEGVMWAIFAARPSKRNCVWQWRQVRGRRAQDLKRRAGGIWDSRGVRSWIAEEEEEVEVEERE